ncbi:hypothetical protein [Actinomadura decatromicini]|uniref:hypothetical protein n=1 Tax=Actinomadura decatromicini TaxID=2604572 RepID=UPI001652C8E0|nr:hypothetical protein [Actinomadura decatromicini]
MTPVTVLGLGPMGRPLATAFAAVHPTTAWHGGPDATLLFSGPDDVYRTHRPTLAALGGNLAHVGADPGRAAGFDATMLDVFWTSMIGVVHGGPNGRTTSDRSRPRFRGVHPPRRPHPPLSPARESWPPWCVGVDVLKTAERVPIDVRWVAFTPRRQFFDEGARLVAHDAEAPRQMPDAQRREPEQRMSGREAIADSQAPSLDVPPVVASQGESYEPVGRLVLQLVREVRIRVRRLGLGLGQEGAEGAVGLGMPFLLLVRLHGMNYGARTVGRVKGVGPDQEG